MLGAFLLPHLGEDGAEWSQFFADRQLACTQLVRDPLLPQPLARLQVAVQDGGSQMLC